MYSMSKQVNLIVVSITIANVIISTNANHNFDGYVSGEEFSNLDNVQPGIKSSDSVKVNDELNGESSVGNYNENRRTCGKDNPDKLDQRSETFTALTMLQNISDWLGSPNTSLIHLIQYKTNIEDLDIDCKWHFEIQKRNSLIVLQAHLNESSESEIYAGIKISLEFGNYTHQLNPYFPWRKFTTTDNQVFIQIISVEDVQKLSNEVGIQTFRVIIRHEIVGEEHPIYPNHLQIPKHVEKHSFSWKLSLKDAGGYLEKYTIQYFTFGDSIWSVSLQISNNTNESDLLKLRITYLTNSTESGILVQTNVISWSNSVPTEIDKNNLYSFDSLGDSTVILLRDEIFNSYISGNNTISVIAEIVTFGKSTLICDLPL